MILISLCFILDLHSLFDNEQLLTLLHNVLQTIFLESIVNLINYILIRNILAIAIMQAK